MSDCSNDVSPINYPDPDPDLSIDICFTFSVRKTAEVRTIIFFDCCKFQKKMYLLHFSSLLI